MREYTFQFAILRYIHDPLRQEFANIGVVMYSQKGRFLEFFSTIQPERLLPFFGDVNIEYLRRVMDHFRHKFQQVSSEPMPVRSLRVILGGILPPDDSSLQFAAFGVGLTDDFKKEFAHLLDRVVLT